MLVACLFCCSLAHLFTNMLAHTLLSSSLPPFLSPTHTHSLTHLFNYTVGRAVYGCPVSLVSLTCMPADPGKICCFHIPFRLLLLALILLFVLISTLGLCVLLFFVFSCSFLLPILSPRNLLLLLTPLSSPRATYSLLLPTSSFF